MEKKGLFFEASETQADDTRDNPPFGHKRLKKKRKWKKSQLEKKSGETNIWCSYEKKNC